MNYGERDFAGKPLLPLRKSHSVGLNVQQKNDHAARYSTRLLRLLTLVIVDSLL